MAAAVTPDSQRIVSGGSDDTVRVWDLTTGRLERTLKGHTSGIEAAAVTVGGDNDGGVVALSLHDSDSAMGTATL
jgi:WD40 repeat protein